MQNICVECGGSISRGQHAVDVRVGRRTVSVPGNFERCGGECGEFYFAPGEMDAVMVCASETIRAEEGLLSPQEIKRLRNRVGLTQAQLEELLGAGLKTVVRWEKGTVIQNGATDTLLRLLRDVPEALQHLLRERAIVTNVVPLVPKVRTVSYQYQSIVETSSVSRETLSLTSRDSHDPDGVVLLQRAEQIA